MVSELPETIGLVVGIIDALQGRYQIETAPGVHGVPREEPYVEIQEFSLSQSRVVVGDRIHASGILLLGLGHVVDRYILASQQGAYWELTVRSSGGIAVTRYWSVYGYKDTPTPHMPDYDVEGEGEGGYIYDPVEHFFLTPKSQRVPKAHLKKICSSDNPILRIPFQFKLQARRVGNEDVWVEAKIKGYKSAWFSDTEATVRDESKKITVEVSKPYEIGRRVEPLSVSHGGYTDASMTLSNRGFDERLYWETSTLDDDYRRGSSLPPRRLGASTQLINKWNEGHSGFHPCKPPETWVTPAFHINPWIITNLRVILQQKPDWTETWTEPAIPVDCVKACNEEEPLPLEVLNIMGQFTKSGDRNIWVPRYSRDQKGREPNDPPKPPLFSLAEPGIKGQCFVRFQADPPEFLDVSIRSELSGRGRRIEVNNQGLFEFPAWPFDNDDRVSLVVSSPGFEPVMVDSLEVGMELEVSLFPLTSSLSGRVRFEGSIQPGAMVVARPVDESPETSRGYKYVTWLDSEGEFRLRGLPVGEEFAIDVVTNSPEDIWVHSPRIIRISDEMQPLVLDLRLIEMEVGDRRVTVSGRGPLLDPQEYGVVRIEARNVRDGSLAAMSEVARNGQWRIEVPRGAAVALQFRVGDEVFATSGIIRPLTNVNLSPVPTSSDIRGRRGTVSEELSP